MTHRSVPVLAAIGAITLYLAVFLATEIPDLTRATGKTFLRADFFRFLLLPEDLAECWCGTPLEFSILDRVPVLLVAGLMLAWAAALGWMLLRLVGADRGMTPLETLVFSSAVGRNAVSSLVLAAGLAGWLRAPAVFIAAAVATWALAGWLAWRGARGGARPPATSSRDSSPPSQGVRPGTHPTPRRGKGAGTQPAPSEMNGAWLGLAVPFAAVLLFGGMLPPAEFDVREYHLQAPKEFFQQGQVTFLAHNVYANMPLGAEMLSLLGMAVTGDWWLGALAGKTVIASYAILTGLALYAAGRRFFSPTAGIVAAVLYVSIPWIIQVSALGLVDAVLGCYLFLAWYAARWGVSDCLATNPRQDEECGAVAPGGPHPAQPRAAVLHGDASRRAYSRLLLAGYLAGSAVACKYPGVLFVLLPLAAWIAWACSAPSRRVPWKALGAFLLAAAVGCGLWLGKNWVLTGNPTYPLLYGAFDGHTWNAEKDRQWNAVHRPHDFSLSTLGRDFGRITLTSPWLSPIVLPLALLAFAVRPWRGLALGLGAWLALVISAWWLLTHRIDRFWIPALPLLALLAGAGAAWSPERLWRRALVILLVFGAVANFLTATSVGGGYNRYFVSLKRLRDDPQRVDPWHRYFNRHARGGKVLLVGDAQPFDLEVPALYNTCFDDSIFEQLVKDRSPEEVRAALAGRGITHVFVHWGEIARYRATYGFTEFVQPEVFARLVQAGVLEPIAEIRDHAGRGFRVLMHPPREDHG